ncbi:WD40-repeat-containing domain protein, partial [Parasitella parasitica]
TRVFSGDVDGSIHVWNAQSNQYVTSLNAHKKHVSCLTRHNHLLASGSSDTTIAIHDIVTFKQLNLLQGHEGPVTSLVFAPSAASDGKLLLVSGSTDRTIRIWNTADSACLRILHGQENTIISLAFCASIPLEYCYIISGSSDRNIFVWDLKS